MILVFQILIISLVLFLLADILRLFWLKRKDQNLVVAINKQNASNFKTVEETQLLKKWRNKEYFGIFFLAFSSKILLMNLLIFWQWLRSEQPLNESFNGLFVDVFLKWDAFHYLKLANEGYSAINHDTLIAFLPGYPLLLKMMFILPFDQLWLAVIFNLLIFSFCAVLVWQLAFQVAGRSVAWRSLWFLLAYPSAIFFIIPYSESWFLLLIALFFLGLINKKWWLIIISGFFASLTKNQGILLVVPLLLMGASELINIRKKGDLKLIYKPENLHLFFQYFLGFFAVIFGFAIYLFINFIHYGDWFAYLIFQKNNWHSQAGFFLFNLWNQVGMAVSENFTRSLVIWWPQVLLFLITLWLIRASLNKHFPPIFGFFALIYLIFSFTPTFLISGLRYLSVLPFFYIMLGLVFEKKKFALTLAIVILMQIYFSWAYLQNWFL